MNRSLRNRIHSHIQSTDHDQEVSMSSGIFQSFQIKDLTLKNRIVMPPMCMYSSDTNGQAKSFHTGHYSARALGGCGLIIQEATAVSPEGRITDHDLGIWNDEQIPGLQNLVKEVQQSGARMAVQLAHSGRKGTVSSVTPVAPSAIPFDGESPVPEELNREGIARLVNAFRDGAKRALQASYDAIEIHGAHGYLIHEFLSPLSNHRTDEYGGDTAGRSRFLLEILDAIKTVWPEERPIILRISVSDYAEGGLDPDEMVRILKHLGNRVDVVHVSSGGLIPVPISASPGYQLSFSDEIRKATGIPTIAVGLITDPHQAEEILKSEQADLVALGRELLRNPHWPYAAASALGISVDVAAPYVRAWL